MNRVSAVMRIHFTNRRSWFYLPWMIVAFSFLVNFIIGFFVNVPIYTGGLSSIFFYMIAAGVVTLSGTFPFALGLSARRTDFFLGTLLAALSVSAASSILLALLSLAEKATGWWGVDLHFFHLPYLTDGSNIQQAWIYFSLILNMYFCGFSIASIYRRFDMTGLVAFFTALFLLSGAASIACTYYQWWSGIIRWFQNSTAFGLSLWMAPLTVIYIAGSYLMLRRAKVQP